MVTDRPAEAYSEGPEAWTHPIWEAEEAAALQAAQEESIMAAVEGEDMEEAEEVQARHQAQAGMEAPVVLQAALLVALARLAAQEGALEPQAAAITEAEEGAV
jgi:hypothetical protein